MIAEAMAATPELRSLLDALPEHTLLIDAAGTILAANRALAMAVGTSADRLVGTSLFDLSHGARDRLSDYLRRCAGTRGMLPGAIALRGADGKSLDYRCDGTGLGIPAAILLRCRLKPEAVSRFTLLNKRIAALTREIVGRHRAEEALRALNETLEERVGQRAGEIADTFERLRLAEEQLRRAQKMEAIGQLTGGVAHDFNNLLMVIRGNIEMLERRLKGDFPDAARLIDGALRGVERATALTNGLLAFARSQPLDPKPFHMNRLLGGMSDLLGRTLGEHIAIETDLAPELWAVSVDRNQFENAVLNLALNARDAMPEGGKLSIETANVHFAAGDAALPAETPPGDYVMIAVGDTGRGIPSDVIDKVFDPFFTTKKFGEGTGLGLSQVYGFIRQSGGQIRMESEEGSGTIARLYLPRLLGGDRPIAEPRVEEAAPPARSGETILVVEDNDEVRAYSTEALAELGYRILAAADGHAALALLAEHDEIDLMFTDVGLPGSLNGRQLSDEARRRRPDLKILFTSGYARTAIMHDDRLDPDVKLIVKPFTFAELGAKIRAVLDGD
ncbi:MAG TPA: ATP-binding protein [Stellaceae bacterium]